jgi:hypothetical protein
MTPFPGSIYASRHKAGERTIRPNPHVCVRFRVGNLDAPKLSRYFQTTNHPTSHPTISTLQSCLEPTDELPDERCLDRVDNLDGPELSR